jgi:ATP-dependent Zn protease
VYRFNKAGGFGQFQNMMDLGKSKAKKFDGEMMKIKFKDVAGCTEAK